MEKDHNGDDTYIFIILVGHVISIVCVFPSSSITFNFLFFGSVAGTGVSGGGVDAREGRILSWGDGRYEGGWWQRASLIQLQIATVV